MKAKRRRTSIGVDIQLLAKRLREHLDAIDAEMTDAHHILDEIEAASEAPSEPATTPEQPRASPVNASERRFPSSPSGGGRQEETRVT